jgi:hypothetical protein
LISADGVPDVLSPLAPFLVCEPVIINVCWKAPVVFNLERPRFSCDLNLFHVPTTDETHKQTVVRWLHSAANYHDSDPPPCDLLAFNRGLLYSPEGAARSFSADQGARALENRETYVHATFWTDRGMCERFKDPNQENGPLSCQYSTASYAGLFAGKFERAEGEGGAAREEIRVDFMRWEELDAFDEISSDERRSRLLPRNPFPGFVFVDESMLATEWPEIRPEYSRFFL